MESIKVYAKRILPDLKSASEHFSDVQLVSNEQVDYYINTNSLILASLSPTLNSALKDLFNDNLEEKIKIIVPSESGIDFQLLQDFFKDALFDASNEDDRLIDKKYAEVLDFLGIKSVPHASKAKPTFQGLKHQCHVCKKSFNLRKLLARHIRTFHYENPHKCLDCGRLCRSQSELKIHMRVHTKERPHQCSRCDKTFTQVSHLNEHLNNVHQEEEMKNS